MSTVAKKIARSGEKPYGIKLNENVIYDPYEDKESEVYARIMQMRFDLKLDPRKIYTPEDVEELRKNLLKKQMEGKLTGADKDINNLIFKRYSDEKISHFLNDTAQFQQIPNNENNYLADIKQIMHKDTENYLKVIASINNPARSFSPTPQNSHKEKTNFPPVASTTRILLISDRQKSFFLPSNSRLTLMFFSILFKKGHLSTEGFHEKTILNLISFFNFNQCPLPRRNHAVFNRR